MSDGIVNERIFLTTRSEPLELSIYTNKYVYKYFKNNEYLKNIIEGELYFSYPKQFNDILDCKINLSDESIKDLGINHSLEAERHWFYSREKDTHRTPLHLKWKDLIYEINNKNYILCLSEQDPLSFDSHYMWGLYGDTGKGFVAKYNLNVNPDLKIPTSPT